MSFLKSNLGVNWSKLGVAQLVKTFYNFTIETICNNERGITMQDYEEQLLTIIREHENPEQALQIAIDIIITFLKQSESSE
jgi:hypothetical protein